LARLLVISLREQNSLGALGPIVWSRLVQDKPFFVELPMSQLYRHSNKFTLLGAVAGMLSGIAAAIPGAFLYVYGIWSIPEAKLRGLCPLTYGALVGASCGIAMCWGKIRNLAVAGVVGFASSLFALYVSWVDSLGSPA
jgi:hypothetical protein